MAVICVDIQLLQRLGFALNCFVKGFLTVGAGTESLVSFFNLLPKTLRFDLPVSNVKSQPTFRRGKSDTL